jgi:4-amino-4-deoxy-L-arabinose transferase-like glycosyltransferase
MLPGKDIRMRETFVRFESFVKNHKPYFLLAIFSLALLLRLFYNFGFLDGNSSIGTKWFRSADSYSYYTAAHQILHFQYSSFDRAPFFPFVIAIVQAIFGRDPTHLRIILSIMGSFTCLLIFLVGDMVFNTSVAVFASLVSVFYLPLIILNSMILSETLFVLLTLLSLLFIFKLLRDKKPMYCVLSGVFMGLAALTRSEFLFIISLMLIALWIAKRKERFGKYILIILVIVMVLTVPWSIYASVKNHTVVPISAIGGITFFGANNPKILTVEFYKKGQWLWITDTWLMSKEDLATIKGMTWGELSDFLYRRSLQWLVHNPGKVPTLLMWKQFAFWFSPIQFTSNFIEDPKASSMTISYCVQYFIILIMFLLGALKTFSFRKHFPFLVYLVGELVIVSIYYGNWRSISFLQPAFLLFAAALIFEPRHRRVRSSKAEKVAV